MRREPTVEEYLEHLGVDLDDVVIYSEVESVSLAEEKFQLMNGRRVSFASLRRQQTGVSEADDE